ncbi:hypothetical protein ATO6_22645 [Oceanicola sp. 22II-s10i]|uniref:hypothetical protein n=1 Tax=Oceanicola sp. 22II-s10i TaxID=1317116 RepID=UPI000B5217D8|nr:hypothetical protein [Oceanicola sp. 22II-s10i]OWU82247.1 hypothetical protein ATO6_22645 [Oceanicola sp. 22II-s10i]
MTSRKILVVGNSHTQMVAKAEALRKEGPDYVSKGDVTVRWLKTQRHGDTPIEQAMEEIAALGPDDLLVLTRLGTLHNVLGLFVHDRPYVILRAGQKPQDDMEGYEVLPVATLRSSLAEAISKETLLREMRDAAPCRTIHYSSPPPKRELRSDGKLRTLDSGEQVRMKFSDIWTRLAFWNIETEVANEFLTEIGIEICPVPPKAFDPDGFLAEPFCGSDATHANQRYGARLLDYFESL